VSEISSNSARGCIALLILSLAAGACTDGSIAFDDPVLSLADSAGGFLGYQTLSSKRTLCGSCHGDEQTTWAASRHAQAWTTLQASGSAVSTCESCHTVSEYGNALVEAAGYSVVPEASFGDVQCESCHGPGLDHLARPGDTQPQASILAGSGLTNGCGECHGADSNPSLVDWDDSHHSSPSSYAAGREDCAECHEGKKALLVKFGETADYLEKADTTTLVAITCAVCHDPHGSEHDKQLRASITTGSLNHLCVKCHSRTAVPPSSHGPHGAQGLLVLGQDVGWIPPAFDTTLATTSSHALATKNERICVTCHVVAFDEAGTDIHSTGHTFRAASCLDAQGLPTAGPCDNSERDFRACVDSDCHATEAAALNRLEWLRGTLNDLLDEIWVDDNSNGRIDVTDDGLLPQVVALGDSSDLDLSDETITVAEGALWNAQLAHSSDHPWFGEGEVFGEEFSAHRSSGNGVHNGFLLRRLLSASIEALIDEYDLTPAPGTDRQVGGSH
jgi:predicted CXXCH cytochrome family protein